MRNAMTVPMGSTAAASLPAQLACAMCGAVLAGPYCHACGQPSRAARRPLRDALAGQTGRTWRTLRLLLARPGELAREVDEARDRDSVRPLTLLLHVIALFFLLSSLTDFRLHAMEQSDTSGALRQAIDQRAAKAGIAREVYAERVERRFQSAYTLLAALASIVCAGALAVLHRRSGKTWLVHVAAAIHFMCAVFVFSLAAFVVGRAAGWSYFDHLAAWNIAVNAIGFAYLVLMIRRVYREPWPRAVAKGAVVLIVGLLADTLTFIASLNVALRMG
jgi:hypothetical protein